MSDYNKMSDAELDRAVAEKVFGLKTRSVRGKGSTNTVLGFFGPHFCDGAYTERELEYHAVPRSYSTDISAAWEVVEKMLKTHWPYIKKPASGKGDLEHWQVAFYQKSEVNNGKATDQSICRAICLAALQAKGKA